MIRIGKRLQAVADMVPECRTAADIGTDHGYVPAFLLLSGKCKQVIASDIAEGPCRSARETREKYRLQHVMDVRKAPGLQSLAEGEAEAAVIAGMGGATILKILEEEPGLTKTVKTFVLQPMNAAGLLRNWLVSQDFRIADEALCKENDHIYVIIKAVHADRKQQLTDIETEIGPCILKNRPLLWKEYITEKAARLRLLLEQMRFSATAGRSDKFKNTEKLLGQLEQLLFISK